MSNIEKYKKYFTKEYLMGPNSFRLLDELISRCPEDVKFDRTLDLGCGYAKLWRNNWDLIPKGSKIFGYDVHGSWADDFEKYLSEHTENEV